MGTIARLELRDACANRAWVLRAMAVPKGAFTMRSARFECRSSVQAALDSDI
jgi:hypothetical protein